MQMTGLLQLNSHEFHIFNIFVTFSAWADPAGEADGLRPPHKHDWYLQERRKAL